MNHIGLFEGIGGFSLAAREVGWQTIAWCEINDFCKTVLSYHFPKAKKHDDIRKTDFTIYRGKCDILTGGFPCQPFSIAGKQLGTEDERHLWPEMLRAIREIQPRWVVGENVGGILNWNGGLVFEQVHIDLENEGYEVQAFVLPAVAVNAPHRRDRVWFVAHKNTDKDGRRSYERKEKSSIRKFRDISPGNNERISANDEKTWNAPHADKERLQRGEIIGSPCNSRQKAKQQSSRFYQSKWQDFPTQSAICGGDDGIPTKLDSITVPKWKTETIKAYGNAIVPQVAIQIYKSIIDYESTLDN
jgi:DNA (cytosine-5)-methyltransferase 1